MAPQPFSIDTLLERVAAEDASDLHVTSGSPPLLRMRGKLTRLEEFDAFSPEQTRDLLYRILSTEQQKRLEIDRQIDFSYSVPGIARFRVNVYFQRDSLAAAFRLVPQLIKSAQDLGLPEVLLQLACEPRGLVSDLFPAAQQGQVRMQLAASRQGVVTQTLLPSADGRRRVPALEVLLPDDAVRNLIRQGKTEQIYSVMQTNTTRGMQTMEQCLADLVVRRVITQETAFNVTSRREEFEALLARSGIAPRTDEHLPEALRGLRVAGAAQ